MGGFHIAFNFLSLIGKKSFNFVLDDLFIEWGVYGAESTLALMKGKSYNRGIRAHRLCMEALFRLIWNSFYQWLNNLQADEECINEETLLNKFNCLNNINCLFVCLFILIVYLFYLFIYLFIYLVNSPRGHTP